jgi:hypothetical protein
VKVFSFEDAGGGWVVVVAAVFTDPAVVHLEYLLAGQVSLAVLTLRGRGVARFGPPDEQVVVDGVESGSVHGGYSSSESSSKGSSP